MKKYTISTFIFLLCFITAISQNIDERYAAVEKAFQGNDFNTAIRLSNIVVSAYNIENLKTDSTLWRSYFGAKRLLNEALRQVDLKAAIQHIEAEEHIDWAKITNNYTQIGDLYKSYGGSYHSAAQFRLARDYYEKALKVKQQNHGEAHIDVAKLYHNVGNSTSSYGDYRSAITYFHKAIDIKRAILKDTSEQISLAISLDALANDYWEIGAYLESKRLHQEAVAIATYNKIDFRIARYTTTLAIDYFYLGQYETALNTINSAIEKWDNFPLQIRDIGWAYNTKGVILRALGRYEEALDFHYQALEKLKQTGLIDDPLLSNLYIAIGAIHYELENYQEALSNYDQALKLLQEVMESNQLTLADLYNLKSGSYRELSQFDLANHDGQKALAIWEKLDHPELPRAYTSLARIDYLQKNYSAAIINYQKALQKAIAISGKEHKNVVVAYTNLAKAYLGNENFESALLHIQKALKPFIQHFDSNNLYQNPTDLESYTHSTDLVNALHWKGKILTQRYLKNRDRLRELQDAYETQVLAIKIIGDKLRAPIRASDKKILLRYIKNVYEDLLKTINLLDNKTAYVKNAFALIDQNRAFLLQEALEDHILSEEIGISEDFVKARQTIASEIEYYQKRLFDVEKGTIEVPQEDISIYKNELFKLKQAQDSLQKVYVNNYKNYYTHQYDISHIQRSLASDEMLLEYFIGDSTLSVFTVTTNKIVHHTQKIDDNFWYHLNAFQQVITRQPNNQAAYAADLNAFKNSAYFLYQKLLPPIDLYENVIIIPDGQLGYLPFELLLVEASSSKATLSFKQLPYLFRTKNIRYEYAASMLGIQYSRSKNATQLYAGFAPSYSETATKILSELDQNRNYGDLDYNVKEVERAAKLIGSTNLWINEDATKENYLAIAPNTSIIHLSMHGDIDNDNPSYSKLVFANTEEEENSHLLYAYELYNMELNAELVVLSACNSGSGILEKGNGILSFARAFKHAGCPNLVTSLWNANDNSSFLIIANFFENLEKGLGKSTALTEAKRNYLNETVNDMVEEYAHPFYWSNFILIGDNRPTQPTNRIWIWIAIALSMLLGIVLWRYRQHS
ncbi:MAG: CHAT domain-containing tetratricopeptide repeat protein [Bacteroidota bacterium]